MWAGIIATPIESCHILWSDQEHGPASQIPEAVQLRTATGQVWIADLERAPLDGDTRRAYGSRVRTFLALHLSSLGGSDWGVRLGFDWGLRTGRRRRLMLSVCRNV
ncbi:hypothetical protein GCM10010411_87670 [Actinomadura fulvescens]|uniref:Uncharacterized protein n=1 Tax=Actinomadura fulvescens TaxID=46160 RepID=A0ABP6D425_9ACTN